MNANILGMWFACLLGDAPLVIREWVWFTHSGAPHPFSLVMQGALNNVVGLPTIWLKQSPDFSPLDFYPWYTESSYLCVSIYGCRNFASTVYMAVMLSATPLLLFNVSRYVKACSVSHRLFSICYKCSTQSVAFKSFQGCQLKRKFW